MTGERLSDLQKETLRVLADTFVPSREPPFIQAERTPSASEAGVDREIRRIVEEYLPTQQRIDFLRFLTALDSPMQNLLLVGKPVRFRELDQRRRERYLFGWAKSPVGLKRKGFQSAKRLVDFVYYARPSDERHHPVWTTIGYEPRSSSEGTPEVTNSSGAAPERPEADGTVETDVCIVGSGAGGATVAALVAAAGYKVVILEAGPWIAPTDLPQTEAEAFDRMYEGHGIVTTDDISFQLLAGATAGGSTAINWMTCLRPLTVARNEWEHDFGMSGVATPSFDHLLDLTEQRLAVTSTESQLNPSNEVLRLGCERLQYRLGLDYEIIRRNAKGCAQRCGFCSFGCPYGAKQSMLQTYLADAMSHGARLYCDTTAQHIVIDKGKVGGVDAIYTRSGKSHRLSVRSRAVVVAAGALRTPVLLLRSGLRTPGIGLGLRLDPTTAIVGDYAQPIRMWEGPMQTVAIRKFQGADTYDHGPWIETAPAHPGLSALAFPWTSSAQQFEGIDRLAHAAASITLVRDWAEGRVAIDGHGDAVYRYRLTPRDRRNLTLGIVETARVHWAAGARRIFSLHTPEISVGDGKRAVSPSELDDFSDRVTRAGIRANSVGLFSAHPMGSARAGNDPKTCAARPTGQCHGVEGLWIADGSLLPTAPGVNPMITIVALAHRTAGFLLEQLAGASHA